MKTSLTVIEGLARELKVELPIANFQAAVEAETKKISKTVKLNGFRDGKVPISIIKQKFGDSIAADTAEKIIGDELPKAFKEEKVSPAAAPDLVSVNYKDSVVFSFTVKFDVFPEVNLKPLSELNIEQIQCDIKEEDIDKTINDLRKQQAVYNLSETEAAIDDKVNIDFVGKLDGVVFEGGQSKNFEMTLGDGKMIPGFDEAIVGKKAGDVFDVDITFPASYQSPQLAGKLTSFNITLNSVSVMELPALDDKLAQSFNEESVEALRTSAKNHLDIELTKRLSAQNKDFAFLALVEANPLEIPKSSVQAEAKNLYDDMAQKLEAESGQKPDLSNMDMGLFADEAARRVRLGLLINNITAEHKFEVSAEEITNKLKLIALEHKQPEAEVIKWYMGDKDRLGGINSLIVEDKAAEYLISQGKVSITHKTFEDMTTRTES